MDLLLAVRSSPGPSTISTSSSSESMTMISVSVLTRSDGFVPELFALKNRCSVVIDDPASIFLFFANGMESPSAIRKWVSRVEMSHPCGPLPSFVPYPYVLMYVSICPNVFDISPPDVHSSDNAWPKVEAPPCDHNI